MTWGVVTSGKSNQEKPIQNVSGVVPISVRPHPAPSNFRYNSSCSYIAALTQLIAGILCFLAGLLQTYLLVRLGWFGRTVGGYGETCGLFFIAAGAVGVTASRTKAPRRITASLILSILSFIIALVVSTLLFSVGLRKMPYIRKICGWRGGRHSSSERSHERDDRSIFARHHHHAKGSGLDAAYIGTQAFLFVFLMVIFAASIAQTVYCARALKSKDEEMKKVNPVDDVTKVEEKKDLATVEDLPKIQV